MKRTILKPNRKGLVGTIDVPGDKSITHRAIMLGAVAEGRTTVKGYLKSADCESTLRCIRQLGVQIDEAEDSLLIHGQGWDGLKETASPLNVGNSGTTIRLLSGILSGRPFRTVLTGDASIRRRPMRRIIEPLRKMGAEVTGEDGGNVAPIRIEGGRTNGICYPSPIASAQVKSAILFCGMQSDGVTEVSEPYRSRDHSERMLKSFGAELTIDGNRVRITGKQWLKATDIEVPGDISSAAFFLGAGAITPGSRIILRQVGLNPTRAGILDVLQDMGAELSISNKRMVNGEPVGDLTVSYSTLIGTDISGDLIPRLIDEIPIIALVATQAEGVTRIKDARELRLKETDRIETIASELRKLGGVVETTEDGFVIHGKQMLHGGTVVTHGDHRIGMMLAAASCITSEEVVLEDIASIGISYPGFLDDLRSLADKH